MTEYQCTTCKRLQREDKGGKVESLYCPFCNSFLGQRGCPSQSPTTALSDEYTPHERIGDTNA